MNNRYFFLNTGIIFWSLALLACLDNKIRCTIILGVLTLGALTTFQLKQQGLAMFKRKNAPQSGCISSYPIDCTQEKVETSTVIAAGAYFDGGLTAPCNVYIYGEMHGDITANGYSVNIMSAGVIHGNISCEKLIIDGTVIGKCQAESVDILEHGNMNGALVYGKLSIRQNGVFTGTAETSMKQEEETASTLTQTQDN